MNLFSILKKPTASTTKEILVNTRNIRDYSMELSKDEKIVIDFLSNIDKEFLSDNGKNDLIAQGKYFEEFLLSLFTIAGYDTQITDKEYKKNGVTYYGDKNVDLIAIKNNEKIAIQAKNYRLNTKAPKLIDLAFINKYSGISDNGWTNKLFITTTFFNPYVYNELKENEKTRNIEWIDRIGLFSLINSLAPEVFIKQNFQHSLPNTVKKCNKCNHGYLVRKYSHNYFYGCTNFPECDYTEKI
ncbi:restriction endonuclease [Lactococcus petauri]|uniref:restriction endonuclease n=1 Tax=Lactococcus petauri TaxID=1940789 RepID=UPI003853E2CB